MIPRQGGCGTSANANYAPKESDKECCPPPCPEDPPPPGPPPGCCGAASDSPEEDQPLTPPMPEPNQSRVNEDEGGGKTGCSSCATDKIIGGGKVKLGSALISVDIGHSPWILFKNQLLIHKDAPSPTTFTPQSLAFPNILGTFIVNQEPVATSEGDVFQVTVSGMRGRSIVYEFPMDGNGNVTDSVGAPIGYASYIRDRLHMLDVNGDPTTTDPVYYDRVGDGNTVRYEAAAGKAVRIDYLNGSSFDLNTPGIELDVVRDGDVFRQIKDAQCLADIVVIDEFGYEIRLYPVAQAGSKNAEGLYEPWGDPIAVWAIENPTEDPDDIDQIQVTRTLNGGTKTWTYAYAASTEQWTLDSDGMRIEKTISVTNEDETERIETYTLANAEGEIVYEKENTYHIYNNGNERLFKEVVDPDGEALTTTHTYYASGEMGGKLGRKRSVIRPYGTWAFYNYDELGRKTADYAPFKNSPIPLDGDGVPQEPNPATCAVTTYDYSPIDASDIQFDVDPRPRTITKTVLGVVVSKTYNVYQESASGAVHVNERAATTAAAYGDPANLRTVTEYYPESAGNPAAGFVKSVTRPDETMMTHQYEYGTYNETPDPVNCSFTPGAGQAVRTTVVTGTVASPDGVANKTTKTTSVTDIVGNEVMNETYVYTGSGYERIDWTVRTYDDRGRVVAEARSDGTESSAAWGCCGKDSETLFDGTQYVYSYDPLSRLISTTRVGHGAQPDLVTSYTYDEANRLLSKTVSGGGLSLATAYAYDSAGRLISTTAPDGLVTSRAYADGGRVLTVTRPGGATEIQTLYLDGSVENVTGTAVVNRFEDMGVNPDGSQWSKTTLASASGPNWTRNTFDVLGRVVKREQPAFDGSTNLTVNYYDDVSQLIKTAATGRADTLYEYDSLGNRVRFGLDVDDDGALVLASMDRINDGETAFEKIGDDWWRTSTAKVYAKDNDATATTTSISKSRLTGFTGDLTAETVSIDVHGNQTVAKTFVDAANKTVTQTVDHPDSTVDSQTVTVNGLLISSRSKSNLTTTYSYDSLGRQTGVTDPRTGTSVTHFAANGRIDYIEDAASNRTSFEYDSATGRRTVVENALGKKRYASYNNRGQQTRTWGAVEYPVEQVYDDYGRMVQLKTFRNGTGWDQPVWPADPGTADVTTWTYQESTGLLTAKTYADGKGTTYSYNADGSLSQRVWSRSFSGQPLTTSYSYNLTDDMTGVDYSDSTPDITYAYDRLGRQKTVTDVVGTRTFAYDDQLQLQSETITGLYDKVISRKYSDAGFKGRLAGFSVGDAADTDCDYDLDYVYDGYGRFQRMSGTALPAYGVEYARLANSNLIESLSYKTDASTTIASATTSYEANRDLVTTVENKWGATTISKYDYVNDAIGRRTSMAKSGTAFSTADTISYGYNDRSEVTSAVAGSDPLYDYGFAFDNIGNRQTSTTNESGSPVSSDYTSNNLNQYTAITNPTRTPTYNDDGCMLTNDGWAYSWNGENRFVEAVKTGDKKLEFKYDYEGRRVEKKVYEWDTDHWSLITDHLFLYDGWNLIEILDAQASNAPLQKFTWGLDLSQTLQGAGGVGGLLACEEVSSGNTFYYFYDANGNVGQVINGSGAICAQYEYSPFGEETLSIGSFANENPFRFSTKFIDSETGLVYYGFRYYDSAMGRWLSRDPIRETGGINLYGFCNNGTIYKWDILGYSDSPLLSLIDSILEFMGYSFPCVTGGTVNLTNIKVNVTNKKATSMFGCVGVETLMSLFLPSSKSLKIPSSPCPEGKVCKGNNSWTKNGSSSVNGLKVDLSKPPIPKKKRRSCIITINASLNYNITISHGECECP